MASVDMVITASAEKVRILLPHGASKSLDKILKIDWAFLFTCRISEAMSAQVQVTFFLSALCSEWASAPRKSRPLTTIRPCSAKKNSVFLVVPAHSLRPKSAALATSAATASFFCGFTGPALLLLLWAPLESGRMHPG